jgi:TonB-linked SusC/RagA family outer membrane protein
MIKTVLASSGNFSIPGCMGDKFVISHVGYETIELNYPKTLPFIITLDIKTSENDPAVVKGYVNEDPLKSISPSRKYEPELPVNTSLLENIRGQFTSTIITPTSGMPGASQFVNIRGFNSIGSDLGWTNRRADDPLVVIDGIPMPTLLRPVNILPSMTGDPQSTGITSAGLNPLYLINSLDVASVQILKDASSTAIYGSRGSNGVLVIRTKMASDTSPTITFSSFTGTGHITTAMNLMNRRQYLDMRYQAYQFDGIDWKLQNVLAPDLKQLDTIRETDWKNWLLGSPARVTDHYLTYSDKYKRIRYLFSGGYHHETTVLPGDIYGKRLSLASDVSYRSKNNKLTTGLTAFRTGTRNNWITDNAMYAMLMIPNGPSLRNDDGSMKWEENGASFLNPLSYFKNTLDIRNNNTLVHTHSIYKISRHLKAEISVGYNAMATNEEARYPMSAKNPNSHPLGAFTVAHNNYRTWSVEPQLQHNYYDPKRSIRIETIVGASWLNQKNDQIKDEQKGYTNDDSLGKPNQNITSTITPNQSIYKYLSAFTRSILSLKDRYQFTSTFRIDESSRFGTKARLAKLGSVGAAWIIKKQNVADQTNTLNFAKLRGSMGITGNDQIGDYRFLNDYTVNQGPQYQGQSSLVPSALANPEYHWIYNKKLDVAFDTRLFGGILDLTLLYYLNRTTDQLINHPLPAQTGFTSITDNFSAMVQNSGFELEANIYKTWGNLTYNGRLTLSTLRNKLVSFPHLQESIFKNTLVEGKSLTVEKGYQFGGVDPNTGLFTLKDSSEPGVIGNNDPFVMGGYVQTIRLFGFQLQTTWELQVKKATHYMTYVYGNLAPGRRNETLYMNQPADLANHWEKQGDQASWQKFSTKGSGPVYNAIRYWTNSNDRLVNASFVLLKNVLLTYDVNKKFINRFKIKKMKMFANGENLLLFTPYKGADPQIANPFTLPPLKVLTFGLSITL